MGFREHGFRTKLLSCKSVKRLKQLYFYKNVLCLIILPWRDFRVTALYLLATDRLSMGRFFVLASPSALNPPDSRR